MSFQEVIIQHCKSLESKWPENVMARIKVFMTYQLQMQPITQVCSSIFRTGKNIQLVFMSDAEKQPNKKLERLKDQEDALL